MAPIPLRDACVVLSWRGWPVRWAWRLRRRAKHLLLSDPERLPAWLLQIVRLRRA
jgi:hypothetical protein